jgi:hypothetical protein
MVEYLEKAARSLVLAERYEMLGEIYKLVIPIYEFHRDYEVCNPDCKFFHSYNGHAPCILLPSFGVIRQSVIHLNVSHLNCIL